MKKVLLSIVVFFVLLVLAAGFTSCSKEAPAVKAQSITNRPVMLEYRITNESGNVGIRYTTYENGVKTVVESEVNRMDESIFLEYPHNATSTIESWNMDGLHNEIILEIFVEGQVIASGSLNYNTNSSKAEGLVL